MTLDSSGNLLVGTTTYPTDSVSTAGVGITNSGATYGRINFGKTVSGGANGISFFYTGTYVGGLTYSNTATALVASSDQRLKQNITPSPSALDKAMNIEVVSYDWKHDPTHVEFGLIAQQLNTVYSEAVNVGDDKENVEKTWGLEYGRLTPLLLKAIQELKAINDTQAETINALTARIVALEAK
jgi:hypothetical protein